MRALPPRHPLRQPRRGGARWEYGGPRRGRRLLRVVRIFPSQCRVPVSGVSTCAEYARGAELGEEGRGSGRGEQDTRRHKSGDKGRFFSFS